MFNLLGALLGLILSLFILSFFLDRKTLLIVFVTVVAAFAYVVIKVHYSTPEFVTTAKLELPVMGLIAKTSPNEFARYEENINKTNDIHEKIRITGAFLNSQFSKYLNVAPNKVVYDFLKNTLEQYKIIFKKNPEIILAIEMPDKFKDKTFYNDIDQNIMKKLVSFKSEVIKAGIENPQPTLTPAELDKANTVLQQILSPLKMKYGVNKIQQLLDDPAADPSLSATIFIELYEAILTTGEEDTGLIIKYLNS